MKNLEDLKQMLLSTNEFEDNVYLMLYCQLLKECAVEKILYKTQRHHIIPRCYFKKHGKICDDSESNIVVLFHKDHVKAHIYLALCASTSQMMSANKHAVIYALNHPCIDAPEDLHQMLQLPEIFEAYQSVMEIATYVSDEQRKKISEGLKGKQLGVPKSEEFKQNLRAYYATHPKKPYEFTEEQKQQIGNSVSLYWQELDQDTKLIRSKKISQKLKGKPKPEGFSERLSRTRHGKDNPFYGKHHSEKTKKEASERMLANNPFKGKHHKPEDLERAVQTRIANGSYGPRIWINNGVNNKFIIPQELSAYEKQGYMKGKLPHKKHDKDK